MTRENGTVDDIVVDAGFREFVETRYLDLLRVAYYLTGSPHEAEDLLQGVLVKVMRRWRRVDDPMAYLRRAMINQYRTRWRTHLSREVVVATPRDTPTGDIADAVAERHAVLSALQTLAPRTRAVVVLRFVEDLPEAAVAQTLGCSVGTVKSQASRGLARLRIALERAGGPAEATGRKR
jgi:RNA polymerase sigma-70 factor (sigma-E family)